MTRSEPLSLGTTIKEGQGLKQQDKQHEQQCTNNAIHTASFTGSKMPIKIKNVSTDCLIDTGAMTSFISSRSLRNVDEMTTLKVDKCKIRKSCKLADKTVVPILGEIKLPCYINKVRYNINFCILKEMNGDVIIGMDFLQNHGAHLKIGPKETKLSFSTIPVYANCALTLPAQSEVIVAGNLSRGTKLEDKTVLECFPFQDLARRNVISIASLVTSTENAIPIRLANFSDQPQVITKDRRIASVKVADPDKFVKPEKMYNQQVNKGCKRDEKRDSLNSQNSIPRKHKRHVNIDFSQSQLTENQKNQMQDLIDSFEDCFVDPMTKKLGYTDIVQHKIKLKPNSKPISRFPYRMSPKMRSEMERIVKEQVDQDIIEETTAGEFASPALLVKKKGNDGMRLVIDYRGLNAQTIDQCLVIPRLDSILDDIGQGHPKYFSTMDLQSGFHQIGLHEDSKPLTAFLTPHAKYQYKRMPMGLKGSPMSFQSLMDQVLAGIRFKFCLAYLDDICCYSRDFETHLLHLKEVFLRLRKANLKLKPSKCLFARAKVPFLGHILTPSGILPDPDKISAFRTYPVPKSVKNVRQFLGATGFYRRFIEGYSKIARPLHYLTKKDIKFKWTEECQKAFNTLKDILTSDSLLGYPDFSKPFILATDASSIAIGGTLSQKDEKGRIKPIAFTGRSLTPAESKYSTTEQELLAVIHAFKQFEVYLQGQKFLIQTDHSALKYLLGHKDLTPRLARWALIIQGFDYEVQHVKGSENNVPDALSRRSYDYTRTEVDNYIDNFPDINVIKQVEIESCNKSVQTDNETDKEDKSQKDHRDTNIKYNPKQCKTNTVNAAKTRDILVQKSTCPEDAAKHSKIELCDKNTEMDSENSDENEFHDYRNFDSLDFTRNCKNRIPSVVTTRDETTGKETTNNDEKQELCNGSMHKDSEDSGDNEFKTKFIINFDQLNLPRQHIHNKNNVVNKEEKREICNGSMRKSSEDSGENEFKTKFIIDFDPLNLPRQRKPITTNIVNKEEKRELYKGNMHGDSEDSGENEFIIEYIDFDPLYLPRQRKPNINNAVITNTTHNQEVSNTDDTLCALRSLFEEDSANELARNNVSFAEPIEEIFEYDNDRPLMAILSNKVGYQSEKENNNENVFNELDGQVNSILTETLADSNNTENIVTNENIRDTQSKSQKRKQKLMPTLQKSVDDKNDEIDLNPEEILRAQGSDSFCKPILEYLRYKILPRDQKEARAIILREEDYVIINGLLYHIFTPLGSKAAETKAQLVVPREMVSTILQLHHDTSFSGHLSVPKMMSLIRPRYYWPNMMKNAVDYYTSCQTCNATKRFTRTIKPPMQLFDISPAPFSHIEIDQIGPLPRTDRGYLYINTVVDLFSKYVIAWPSYTISGEEFSKGFYDHVLCVVGAPKVISTDNGSCFISTLFKGLCTVYGISHRLSSSLKPSTQGAVERTNRSILSVLRAYTNTRQTDWDLYISSAAFALNSSDSYALKYSPFLMVYGRSPTIPPDMNKLDPLEFPRPVIDHLVSMLQTQEQIHKLAIENFKRTQGLMKIRYDERSTGINLQAGDIVWLHVPRLRKQRTKLKLQPVFQGPYIIVRFSSVTTCILRRLSDGKFISKPVTVCRLKRGTLRTADQVTDDQNTDKPSDTQPKINKQTRRPETQRVSDNSKNKRKPVNTPLRDAVKPAARKIRESEVYHDISKITQCSQAPDSPIRIEIRFTDGDVRWLPIECLNTQALALYRSLNLKVNKVRDLRTRK